MAKMKKSSWQQEAADLRREEIEGGNADARVLYDAVVALMAYPRVYAASNLSNVRRKCKELKALLREVMRGG